jgi:hypothetical protein
VDANATTSAAPSARLFLCARCRCQVVLCSACDRGQRYCGRACSRQSRDTAKRSAARRYQHSHRGRVAHAARSLRWRRHHQSHARDQQAELNKVTHQGSQLQGSGAPLVAWTHDHASMNVPLPAEVAAPTSAPAAATPTAVTDAAPPPLGQARNIQPRCWRCAAPLGMRLRQGFLRHGARLRTTPGTQRHDHSS